MSRMTATYDEAKALAQRTVVDPRYPHKTYTFDPIWVLYDRILNVTPETVDCVARDRFLLSKGHQPAAYYAVLAARRFIPESWLDDVGGTDSPLGGHPDATRTPGVEISSGSLGHGLPLGIGQALGLRAQGLTDTRVYVLVGDGELDEGSNHEAIAYAGEVGIDQVTVIVTDNGSATHGQPGDIDTQFAVNGWTVSTVDGSDLDGFEHACREHVPGRPHAIIATATEGEHP